MLPESVTRRWLRPMVVAVALAWTIGVVAQVPAFRRIDGKDGLPQSQIQAFMEDQHGFIWVGTLSGVARLGAGRCKVFDLASGLGAGRVYGFLEDDQGDVWIAQAGAALARIQGNRVETFDRSKGLPETECFTLALGPEHQLLVGTTHGLYRKVGERFEHVALGGEWNQKPIRSMAKDRQGRLWLGRRDGRLGLWDGFHLQEVTPPFAEASPRITRVALDPQGRVWVLSQKSLWVRDLAGSWKAWREKGFPEGILFEDLSIALDGALVLAMGGRGLWVQPIQGPATWYTSRDGLPDERVSTAFLDRRGILWAGTSGEYIYVLASRGLKSLTKMGETLIGGAYCMDEVGGDVYIGTSRGLFLWKEGQGIARRWSTADGLPGNDIWGVCSDGKGGVWIGSDRGLARLRGGEIQRFPSFKDGRIVQILRDGATFLLASDRGIIRIDAEGRELKRVDFSHYDLPGDVVVLAHAKNRVLVGTGHGLFELQGEALRRIHPEAPFAGDEVVSVYEHQGRDLWVGTSQGLFIQRQGGWARLSAPADLPNSYVYFLGDAGQGLVAVGHGKGVTLMDGQGKAHHLNRNLGLVDNEANQGAVFTDSRGRLWLGMASGLNILETGQPLPLPDLLPPAVLEVRHTEGSSSGRGEVILPPRPEFVEFDFDEGLPIAITPPLYEVRLEGQSAAWQRLGEVRQMRFTRLPGGTYAFRLRASLDGQHWVEGRPVPLSVRRTWLEHPLGRTLLLVAALGCLLGLIRWRTRRLRNRAKALEAKVEDRTRSLDQRNQELEEAHDKVKEVLESKIAFSRMVVHDLRSPLTTMTLLADRMAQEALERGEQPPGEIDMLQREAHRLEDLLQRLLDQARGEATGQTMSLVPANPREVLEGLDEVLQLKAANAGHTFEFREEPGVAAERIMGDALALQQVVLNLFGNALKYTPAPGHLGLRSKLRDDFWVLEVSDTGRGLKPSQIEHLFKPFTQVEMGDITQGWGLGLSIVKNLVDAHYGVIEVDSAPGKGTIFRVLIPLLDEPVSSP